MKRRNTWLTIAAAGALHSIPGSARAAEPDEIGPYEVATESYDLGDEAFQPVDLGGPVEMRAVVYYPQDLDEGPFPIVFVMHGRHGTCFDPANPSGSPDDGSFLGAFGEWPCRDGRIAIPSHEGYAYLGQLLASHGFIVVSVSANGINAFDNDAVDFGMAARADLLNEHLRAWGAWSSGEAGPLRSGLARAADFEHIGAIGHSRGGEGVVQWASLDQADGEPNWIDALLLLAPVDFGRLQLSNVPLGVVLPYCDGDVFDLHGVHYFDDARHALPGDLAPKYVFLMGGSNHNFYNTVWSPEGFVAGAVDDYASLEAFLEVEAPDPHCGPGGGGRLSEAEQRASLLGYAVAFFRAHLTGEQELEEVLRGDVIPASAAAADPAVDVIAPDAPATRLDVNRLDDDDALEANLLGEAVEVSALARYDLCGLEVDGSIEHCVDEPGFVEGNLFDGRQPHTPGLGQLRIEFEDGGSWTNRLPVGTDVSQLEVLQLRLAVDFESDLYRADIDVGVRLTDGRGRTASTTIGSWSDALAAPLGELYPILPRKVLRAVRIPLDAFEGVDLTDVASITLVVEGGTTALLLSDLSFTDARPELGGDTGTTGGRETEGQASEDASGDESSTSGAPDEPGTSGAASNPSGDDGCGCRTDAPNGSATLWLLGLVACVRRRPLRTRPL